MNDLNIKLGQELVFFTVQSKASYWYYNTENIDYVPNDMLSILVLIVQTH